MVALLITGTVMVNSASLTSTNGVGVTLNDLLLGRNTWFALAAAAALWLGTRMPVERLFSLRGLSSPIPWIVLVMFLGLVLVHVPGRGMCSQSKFEHLAERSRVTLKQALAASLLAYMLQRLACLRSRQQWSWQTLVVR